MTPTAPELCPKCGGPLVKEADGERPCFNCVPIVNTMHGEPHDDRINLIGYQPVSPMLRQMGRKEDV
jgi:hypothetical protein